MYWHLKYPFSSTPHVTKKFSIIVSQMGKDRKNEFLLFFIMEINKNQQHTHSAFTIPKENTIHLQQEYFNRSKEK